MTVDPAAGKASLKNKKAVFAGCVRNCADDLPAVLANIQTMAAGFGECAFVFVEDNSRDDSRDILERWCASRSGALVISSPQKAQRSRFRTVRLAGARNSYIAHVREQFPDFDYLIVKDMDTVNVSPVADEAFVRAIEFLDGAPDRAAVFANNLGAYYDMWAFRHPAICPGDVWV